MNVMHEERRKRQRWHSQFSVLLLVQAIALVALVLVPEWRAAPYSAVFLLLCVATFVPLYRLGGPSGIFRRTPSQIYEGFRTDDAESRRMRSLLPLTTLYLAVTIIGLQLTK
jgi:hypothetical protein